MLKKRQKQTFDFIKKFINKHGYSPSLEEIKRHLRISSVSTAHHHILKLEKEGYIKREKNEPRAIEIKEEKEELVKIPLTGTIAAGEPIEAIEDIEIIKVLKSQLPKSGEHYALRVRGNSMNEEGIYGGDTVIIRKQPTAENGETVVALLNNNEVTLKKIYREKNRFRLQPANSSIEPIYAKELIVQGKVISVIRHFEKSEREVNAIISIETKDDKKINYETILKNWTNTIQCMDCVEGMKQLPGNSIDLVVTSPPYDNIRKYNGFAYNLHATGKEIYRILKEGGIAVMVIQDQTRNFGKTLTSFRTIVDWCDNIGFKLFECVIYRKYGSEGAWWKLRFRVDHEYMPIFLKGKKPQYFNKAPLKIPSKHGGKVMTGSGSRRTDGKTNPRVTRAINPMKCRGTIWNYLMAGDKNPLKRKHPAPFPDQIPIDFIQCFCPENGIILDPFMGSGSSGVAAKKLKRKFIGFEISEEYCQIAKQRIAQAGEYLL